MFALLPRSVDIEWSSILPTTAQLLRSADVGKGSIVGCCLPATMSAG
jgi:hypothetical protein